MGSSFGSSSLVRPCGPVNAWTASSKWKAVSALALSVTAAVLSNGSYESSKYVYALLESVGLSLYAAPAQSVLVAILGLCLFPGARATHSTWVSWSSPRSTQKGHAATPDGGSKAPSAALASKQRALEALGMTRRHSTCGTTQCAPASPVAALSISLRLQRFASISFPALLLQRSDSACSAAGSSSSGSSGTLEATGGSRRSTRDSDSARHAAGFLSLRPTADLDIMADGRRLSPSGRSGQGSPRRRPLGLGLPRVHVELSPLPRLLFHFGGSKREQQQQQQRRRQCQAEREQHCPAADDAPWVPVAGATCGGSTAHSPAGSEPVWEDCAEELPSPTMRSVALSAEGLSEAPASLGLDVGRAEAPDVLQVLTDAHLLQFGAMLGERTSRAALAAMEAGGPIGHPDSLYGSPDTDALSAPWESVVHEATAGVRYWAWRRPLRKGLYLYMTRSVFLGASPSDMRRFLLDDSYRVSWDDAMLQLDAIPNSSSNGSSGGARESAFMHALVKFPKPMAHRSYTYARRVWTRPADGGCYCLSRAAPHPGAPAMSGRAVAVEDYASGFVVRRPAAHLVGDDAGPCCEQLLVYFEDSHVRSGLANLGIRKGLWPLVQRTERALRAYQAAQALRLPAAMGGGTGMAQALQMRRSSSFAKLAPAAVSKEPIRSSGSGSGGSGSSSSSSGSWSLLGMVKASGAALLHAGSWLWDKQALLSTLLPRLELRMVRWVLQRVALTCMPAQLLAFSRRMGGTAPVAKPGKAHARPLPVPPHLLHGPWLVWRPHDGSSAGSSCGAGANAAGRQNGRGAGHAGGVARVLCATDGAVLRRLGSHPVIVDEEHLHEHDGDDDFDDEGSIGNEVQREQQQEEGEQLSEPLLGADWPVAACSVRGWAANAAWAVRSSGSATSSAAGSHIPSSCGSGSDGEAGSGRGGANRRRLGPKQRLMVRLMQAAGLRLAHKLLLSADSRRGSEA